MTQGQFYVGLDINKDRYFPRGVLSSDALNLFINPRQIDAYARTGGDTVVRFFEDRYDITRGYYYNCITGVNADAGIQIGGEAGNEQSIFVPPSVPVTMRFELRGDADFIGESVRIQGFTSGGISHSTPFDYALTGDFVEQTVTFTPDAGVVFLQVYRITTLTSVQFTIQNLMIVSDAALPDVYNTGYASDVYEDITDYVVSVQWNNGMDEPRQDVAPSAQCTLVLNNQDGHFNQDGESAELITNGGFTAWTAGLPDGWTPSEAELPGIFEVSEVGFDSLSGGTGVDSCNLYIGGTGSLFTLYQTILTVGKTYRVQFDIGACASGGIRFYSGVFALSVKYSGVGHHEFTFIAPTTQFAITADRALCNITFDNVSVKEIPRYAGLAKGTLVSVRGFDVDSSQYQLYTGGLEDITPQGGTLEYPTVKMVFSDGMDSLSVMEYVPETIHLDIATWNVIVNVFLLTPFVWPYLSDYWILGESVLGINTIPFEYTQSVTFPVAGSTSNNTILPTEGDVASNRKRGIVVSSYIRDVMAAEFGGRFYFDARTAQFSFVGRNADNQTLVDTYSLTNDDYEPPSDMVYADDLKNKVTISYKQRRTGSSTVVLWASEEDIVIPANSSKRITGRYRDPANELIEVGGTAIEPLARGVDYVVSPTTNQERVTVIAESGTQSTTFNINNERVVDVTLTTLQVRGVPIYAVTEQSVSAQNSASIHRHNQRDEDFNIPLISDPDDALALATGFVSLYSNPITRIKTITFQATKTDARYGRALVSPLGKRIHITQSFDNHDAAYVVIGEKHSLIAGGEHTWAVTWVLKPIDRVSYWILGVTGRSELGTTTVLAF